AEPLILEEGRFDVTCSGHLRTPPGDGARRLAPARLRCRIYLDSEGAGDGERDGARFSRFHGFANETGHVDLSPKSTIGRIPHGVLVRRESLQKAEGILEPNRGLKAPPWNPSALAEKEPVRSDSPAHYSLGQYCRNLIHRHHSEEGHPSSA